METFVLFDFQGSLYYTLTHLNGMLMLELMIVVSLKYLIPFISQSFLIFQLQNITTHE